MKNKEKIEIFKNTRQDLIILNNYDLKRAKGFCVLL
jgi:hypothetical protein